MAELREHVPLVYQDQSWKNRFELELSQLTVDAVDRFNTSSAKFAKRLEWLTLAIAVLTVGLLWLTWLLVRAEHKMAPTPQPQTVQTPKAK